MAEGAMERADGSKAGKAGLRRWGLGGWIALRRAGWGGRSVGTWGTVGVRRWAELGLGWTVLQQRSSGMRHTVWPNQVHSGSREGRIAWIWGKGVGVCATRGLLRALVSGPRGVLPCVPLAGTTWAMRWRRRRSGSEWQMLCIMHGWSRAPWRIVPCLSHRACVRTGARGVAMLSAPQHKELYARQRYGYGIPLQQQMAWGHAYIGSGDHKVRCASTRTAHLSSLSPRPVRATSPSCPPRLEQSAHSLLQPVTGSLLPRCMNVLQAYP